MHPTPDPWDFLADRDAGDHDTPRFKPAHILYYLGGLLAIGARLRALLPGPLRELVVRRSAA